MFGGVAFWLIVAIACLLIGGFAKEGLPWPAAIISVAVLACYGKSILAVVNWHTLLIGAVGYLIVGSLWSLYKWRKYVRRKLTDPRYISKLATGEYIVNPSYKDEFSPSDNLGMVSSWILYWIFSWVWMLTGNLLKTIVTSLTGSYRRITNSAIKAVPADVLKAVDNRGSGSSY